MYRVGTGKQIFKICFLCEANFCEERVAKMVSLRKFSWVSNKIFIFILITCLVGISFGDLEQDEYAESTYRFQGQADAEEIQPEITNSDWFRVRREQGRPPSQIQRYDDSDDFQSDPRFEEDRNSGNVRNRRVYNSPIYSGIPRDLPSRGGGGGDQCKCDLEYVLKYKGVSPRGGNYHVKVFHEESGQFRGSDGGYGGGWQRQMQQQQQQQRPTTSRHQYLQQRQGIPEGRSLPQQRQSADQHEEYYVVEEEPGDRRDMFSRGRDIVHSKGGSDTGSRRDGNGDQVGPVVERIYYKPRTTRATRRLAKLARAVVANSNWGLVGIISSKVTTFGGFPYVQSCRVSDGTPDNSTGVPYVYLTSAILDASYQGDIEISKASLVLSPQQPFNNDGSCRDEEETNWMCAVVTLSGRIVPVTSTQEIEEAANSIASRHPQISLETEGFFAKILIKNVVVIKNKILGHPENLSLNEYYYAN